MTGSYYLWKWADNNLPGPPTAVLDSLLRGEMHPALQPFEARPLIEKLEIAAAEGRAHGEEWDWEETPKNEPGQARFVFVTCPLLDKPTTMRVCRNVHALGFSGYDEQNGQLIDSLLPKLNCFISGQCPSERVYDITTDDLPFLLHRICSREPNPFGILEDRRSRFVQCYAEKRRRFCVEWRENYDLHNESKFDQWRAQDRKRLAALDVPYDRDTPPNKDPDMLLYADTLRIFQAFLREEPRPAQYHWMSINEWADIKK